VWDWWCDQPNSNIGIATGAISGVVVIDVDPRHGGDDGLQAAQDRLGRLPDGPVARTGGGGRHLPFAHPGGQVASRIAIFRGVDVKADGGYIVAPSSLHVSGREYRWLTPPTADPPALPAGWLDMLLSRPAAAPPLCGDCYTEDTEDTRGVWGIEGGSSAVSERVASAIVSTLPTGFGQRHGMVFEFVRALKAIVELREAPLGSLKPYVHQWHAQAKPRVRTKLFEETWEDFVDAWGRVRFPRGTGRMTTLLAKAAQDIPIVACQYERPQLRLLVSLCRQLQQSAGDRPFYLSTRTAAQSIEVSHQQCARWFRMLAADEILRLVAPGDAQSHKAAEYRYTGD
jgi:hypothetical protein